MKRITAICLLAIFAFGCKSIPVQPARTFYNAVGTPYLRYVEADTNLTDDQKRIRRQAVASFDRLLKEAEK